MIRSIFLLLLLLGFNSPLTAKGPWKTTVGRSTNDRESDLVAALIRASRYKDALKVCELGSFGSDPLDDKIAKWAIRKSEVLTARQMEQEQFGETEIESAQAPVSELISSYADHRRLLFLQAQEIAVRRSAAFHSVLQASVSRSDDEAKEIAVRRLLRATTDTLDLAKTTADRRAELDSVADKRNFALVADLVRLQQELRVAAVSMALMQTELFTTGSKDAIAAATQAEQVALEAITKLPVGTPARQEVERLKVESIYRASQFDRADSEAEQLARSYLPSVPPRVQALLVRLDIAQGRTLQAAARLQAFYGDAPIDAEPSIEMDLARVEFLMRGEQSREFGDWLEIVEQRGGVFARRRAEAISLANIRRSNGPKLVDPSIVAAQGQDWLRRGNPSRGGDLLAEAAKAETDPDRAIQRATQAAAALISAERKQGAADVLAAVSRSKPDGKSAAAAHLQAAVLVSSVPSSDALARIEKLLREHLTQWPLDPSASSARAWLIKLLNSKQQLLNAAIVASDLPVQAATTEQVDDAIRLWKRVFRESEPENLHTVSQRFIESFQPLLVRDEFRVSYLKAAALLLSRELLAQLPVNTEGLDEFSGKLLEFRKSYATAITIKSPPESNSVPSEKQLAIWRLTQDGRQFAQHRKLIAGVLQSWDTNSEESIARAELLLWSEQTEQAVALLRKLASESSGDDSVVREAATLLAASGVTSAQQAAIDLWDQLAGGTPQGTPSWHEAKLGAIRSLRQTGKVEEAQRRAKYILLTTSKVPADLKEQYESLARKNAADD